MTLPINDSKLLKQALTHRSYINENPSANNHNERLEFLGDAVLELATSEFLYQRYPNVPEGDLTAYRAALVKTASLARVSAALHLGDQLKLSKGEEMSGGRNNQSLLADTLEAVIGAIYLDTGYQAVVDFLNQHLFPSIDHIVEHQLYKDFKSTLQETVQAKGHASPDYQVINETGPDHNKTFTVAVAVNGKEVAQGTGRSKQEAQQAAAKHALEKQQLS